MSDMSRPGLPPPAPDHDRHDALLVAQLVAGDPLKPEQQAEARRLIGTCGACAALAADLPAVSRAVAQEPVPPRRRDFRLSPQQAEELRGNALTRFLRRLSLPSARAFQPAAAGVLSIGLLLVVAGYAWPEDGTIVVQAEPNLVERSLSSSAAPAEEPAAPAAAPAEDRVPLEDSAPASRSESASEVTESAPLEGAEPLMEESAFADTLAESQAGTSDEPAQQSRAKAFADDGIEADAIELEMSEQSPAPPSPAGASGTLGATADAVEDERRANAAGDDDQGAQLSGADGAVSDEGGPETGVVGSVDDDRAAEFLVVLGLVLALGGAGLLLLGWLARRARDPLAP